MTMPSSLPRMYPEIRFPADFTARYEAPLQFFPSGDGGMSGGSWMITPWPPEDGFADDNQIYHKSKNGEVAAMVNEVIRSRQKSRINQMTHSAMIQGHGGCMECEGGARYGGTPTTIEGAQVLSGRGLHGGVMRTLAGRQFVASRLSSRVNELNERDAVAMNQPYEMPQPEALTENDEIVVRLGEDIDIVNDAFATGNIESETVSAARGILKNLTKAGWSIPQNLITTVLRNVDDMMATSVQVLGAVNPQFVLNADRKKRLRMIFNILERCRLALDVLTASSDLSPQERQMALGSLEGESMLRQSQLARIPARRRLGYIPRGMAGEVYPYQGAHEAPVPRLSPVQRQAHIRQMRVPNRQRML